MEQLSPITAITDNIEQKTSKKYNSKQIYTIKKLCQTLSDGDVLLSGIDELISCECRLIGTTEMAMPYFNIRYSSGWWFTKEGNDIIYHTTDVNNHYDVKIIAEYTKPN